MRENNGQIMEVGFGMKETSESERSFAVRRMLEELEVMREEDLIETKGGREKSLGNND